MLFEFACFYVFIGGVAGRRFEKLMLTDIFSSLDYYSDRGRSCYIVCCRYLGFLVGGLAFYPYKSSF